ncbi:MAG: RICIN domain-containing protein, partial [Epsilonproteobacteria bacterium]|nr:RICIN domain-containing protein [Campylobacterota bacterium]
TFKDRKAEPKESVFGDIARTYFYMRDRYGLKISKSQEKMLIAWNNIDPVNRWEKKRNQLIKKLQGDENLYVTNYQKMEQLGEEKSNPSTDISEVKEELAEEYAFILNYLSAPVAAIVLMFMTLFVVYRRKKATPQEVSPAVQEKKTDTYLIVTQLANSAISINEKNEIIIEKVDKNNPNQHWVFTKANQKKEYFFIENPATGKVIEVEESNSNDGAKIILNKKRSRKNDHQEWKLEASESEGYNFIINKWSLNVLDVRYKKTADGTRLQSFHKKVRGTNNQEWVLQEV